MRKRLPKFIELKIIELKIIELKIIELKMILLKTLVTVVSSLVGLAALGVIWLGVIWLSVAGLPASAFAQQSQAQQSPTQSATRVTSDLSPEDLRANQEIDRKFLEAHRTLDTDGIMDLFSRQPGIFMIGPTGILYQGRGQIRRSVETFFARLVTMTGEIDQVTYLREGKGVVAYGQVTYHRQLKGQAPDTRVAVWSDYRCKENGRWVLVFRHVHWPLAGNLLPSSEPKSSEPAAKAQ